MYPVLHIFTQILNFAYRERIQTSLLHPSAERIVAFSEAKSEDRYCSHVKFHSSSPPSAIPVQ